MKITRSDGIRGLRQGFSISVRSIVIYQATYFGMYDSTKVTLLDSKNMTVVASMVSCPFNTKWRQMDAVRAQRSQHHVQGDS